MALKQILNSPAAYAANVGSTDLDLSAIPIKLSQLFTQVLADDFEDGSLDPRWLRTPQPVLHFTFLSNVSPTTGSFTSTSPVKAQSFQLASTKAIARGGFVLSRSALGGTIDGDLIAEIQGTTGTPGNEVPDGNVLATSVPIPADSIGLLTFPGVVFTDFDFTTHPVLTAGVRYAMVVRRTLNSGSTGLVIYGEASAGNEYPNGIGLFRNVTTGQWLRSQDFANFTKDWQFRLYEAGGPTSPTEQGGTLRFSYTASDINVKTKLEAVFNDSPRDSFELETRFVWNRLGTTGQAGLKFSVALLDGAIGAPPLSETDKDNRLLLEILIRPSPQSNDLSILPVIVDQSNAKRAYSPSVLNWNDTPAAGGFFIFPFGAASGVPVTIKVSRQPAGGVIVKAWKNDDEAGQTFMLTTASPALRTLSGTVHLDVGNSPEVWESQFDFHYFKLSGPTVEASTGNVTFRRQFAQPTKVPSFKFTRTLQAVGEAINVRTRTADTLAALLAAPFSSPHPTTLAGSVETGTPNLPAAKFLEYQLEFIAASPSPLLTSFDIDTVDAVVADDLPIIFSLDANRPGSSTISTTESEVETANTAKLRDKDASTQYASTNATDGTEVGITFVIPLQTVNAVLLRNTNLKGVRVECPVGTTVFDGELTGDDELVTFPGVSTVGVKVVGKSTKTANQQKKIGEVYIGQGLLTLPGFDQYTPNQLVRQGGSYETLGGKHVTFNGVHKYGSTWAISRVSDATLDSLLSIFRTQRQVTFWPEPGARPRDLFDVAWTVEELPYPYSETVKPDGHTVEGAMTELTGRT